MHSLVIFPFWCTSFHRYFKLYTQNKILKIESTCKENMQCLFFSVPVAELCVSVYCFTFFCKFHNFIFLYIWVILHCICELHLPYQCINQCTSRFILFHGYYKWTCNEHECSIISIEGFVSRKDILVSQDSSFPAFQSNMRNYFQSDCALSNSE